IALTEFVFTATEAITGQRSPHLADVLADSPQGPPGTPLTSEERAAAGLEAIVTAAAVVVPSVARAVGGEAGAAAGAAKAEAKAAAQAAKAEARAAAAEAKAAAKAAAARANEIVQGPYGTTTRGELEALANSNGPTLTVKTRLTQAPEAGRAVS